MMETRNKINYTIALVNEFAQRYRLSLRDAFDYLYRYGAIAFVKEFYDVEHTLSFFDAVDDCVQICKNNGGLLV